MDSRTLGRPSLAEDGHRGPHDAGRSTDALPPDLHRCLHVAGRRAVVARVVGEPDLHADLRLRGPGPRGLVHCLAGLGVVARRQPVLLQRRQRSARRQSLVEHIGDPDRVGAQPRHPSVGTRGRQQRGVDPRSGAQRLGMLAGATPRGRLEGGRHPRGTGVRLLARHRHLDHVRTCVGLACWSFRPCSSPISTRSSFARRDPHCTTGWCSSLWSSCSSGSRPRCW